MVGTPVAPAETLRHYFALALLGPAWWCIGKLAQRAKLPLITGYVVGGIVCGPSGKLQRLADTRKYWQREAACLTAH